MEMNRLLKLPAPKPSLLRRWITSQKRVGLSSTGFVKICSRYPFSSWSRRILYFWRVSMSSATLMPMSGRFFRMLSQQVSGMLRNSTPREASASTVSMMVSVLRAMCCAPAPWQQSTYSWIWDFFLPTAGSLMGILMFSWQSVTTMDRRAEYSVCMILSSTDQNLWKLRAFSQYFTAGSISRSGWLPTTWSTFSNRMGVRILLSFSVRWWARYPGRKGPLYLDRSTKVWMVSPQVLMAASTTVPFSSESSQGALTDTPPLAMACSQTALAFSTVRAMSLTPSPCSMRCLFISSEESLWQTEQKTKVVPSWFLMTWLATVLSPVSNPLQARYSKPNREVQQEAACLALPTQKVMWSEQKTRYRRPGSCRMRAQFAALVRNIFLYITMDLLGFSRLMRQFIFKRFKDSDGIFEWGWGKGGMMGLGWVVVQYQIQMKKVLIQEEQQSFKGERESSEDSEQLRDQPTELDFVSKIKKKESMFISYQGMFQSARFNYNHSLSMMYTLVASEGWKLTHGQNTGISQHATQNEHSLVWNFPFEVTYEIKNPEGWPQVVLVVHGKDFFGRSVIRGYGNFHLPSAQGSHTRRVKIFDVIPPSNAASCCAFLMGYINELKQPQGVLLGEGGGRECLKVRPMGEITVKVQVRRYNFQKYGYE